MKITALIASSALLNICYAKLFFKWLLIVFSVIVLGCLLLVGFIRGHSYWSHDRYLKLVELEVISPSENSVCEKDRPLFFAYKNNTGKTIEYIKVNFSARLQGHSTNILTLPSSELELDIITPPAKKAKFCLGMPVDAIKAEYQGNNEIKKAKYTAELRDFRFQEN